MKVQGYLGGLTVKHTKAGLEATFAVSFDVGDGEDGGIGELTEMMRGLVDVEVASAPRTQLRLPLRGRNDGGE